MDQRRLDAMLDGVAVTIATADSRRTLLRRALAGATAASLAALGFDAPVHALLTGKQGEFDRRLQVMTAPRFGIVGSSQDIEVKVTETTPQANSAPVKLTISHQGDAPTVKTVQIGEKVQNAARCKWVEHFCQMSLCFGLGHRRFFP